MPNQTVKLTRDEALRLNEAIDAGVKALDPIWESALAARDAAQETLDRINQMRQEARERQIANLQAVSE